MSLDTAHAPAPDLDPHTRSASPLTGPDQGSASPAPTPDPGSAATLPRPEPEGASPSQPGATVGLQLPLALTPGAESDFSAYLAGPNAEVLAALAAWAQPSLRPPTAPAPPGVATPPPAATVQFIYIFGPPGTGKSHLLQAACQAARQEGLAAACLPLGHPGLEPAVLEALDRWDRIALDGLEAVIGQAPWEEALFHLYNRLRDAGRGLLVAARRPPGELGIHLADLASRLAWGTRYRLKPLDERECAALLRHAARRRGLKLGEEAIAYILKRCPREPGYLLELLGHLDRASLAHKKRPTLPLIRALIAARRGDATPVEP